MRVCVSVCVCVRSHARVAIIVAGLLEAQSRLSSLQKAAVRPKVNPIIYTSDITIYRLDKNCFITDIRKVDAEYTKGARVKDPRILEAAKQQAISNETINLESSQRAAENTFEESLQAACYEVARSPPSLQTVEDLDSVSKINNEMVDHPQAKPLSSVASCYPKHPFLQQNH